MLLLNLRTLLASNNRHKISPSTSVAKALQHYKQVSQERMHEGKKTKTTEDKNFSSKDLIHHYPRLVVSHRLHPHHPWLLTIVIPTKAIISITKSLVEKKILSTSATIIKTHNVQLLENLMYLQLGPPKHEKLHACEHFHYVNICHLHTDQ
jgi:hypothetical protein